MEEDLDRPYSVCTRDDLKEKMNKQINDISEIFCVSKSNATVLLMKHRWNFELLQERLTEDMKKLLVESGLTPVVTDTNQGLSDSSCDEFYEFFDDIDDDEEEDECKISTPFCSHKFSITYWSKYLEKNFFSVEKTLDTISCPHQDCGASVGRDTIKNLTLKDKDRYDGYVLRYYLETKKKQIKQCPAQGCSYFIEFHRMIYAEECGLNVVCLCGHTFCCICRLESHIPVTCNNASDWLSRDFKKLSVNTVMEKAEVDTSCLKRWEACEASLVESKSKFKAFEESNNMVLREGLMLIVQCRQFLKWSCVYEHIHLEREESKKEYLRFLQDYAKTLVQSFSESLKEETGKALSEEVTCSKGNLSAVTSRVGNYFYNFSKALEDGLDVVEVKHYEDFSPYWLCDRCTYANTWLHKACQMCCDSFLH